MYKLNYTYLTELEVDTRQTFTDISSDLLLVHNNSDTDEYAVNMTTLITCWQDYFWYSDNPTKSTLDITFTDILIDRYTNSGGTIDLTKDYNGNSLDENEMMSYAELVNFYNILDSERQWSGNRTFKELSSSITAALSKMHKKLEFNNLYPIGSIVVSDTAPASDWVKQGSAYISENMSSAMSDTELKSTGYHIGKTMNKSFIDPADSVIFPESNGIPKHEHKLEYIPASGTGGSSSQGEAATGIPTYGDRYLGGADGPEKYAGQLNGGEWPSLRKNALAISKEIGKSYGDGDSLSISYSTTDAEVKSKIPSITVAPKTYPISAYVYERR